MYGFGAHNSDKPGEVIGSRLVEVRHFADCSSRLRVVWLVRFVEHLQQMRALGFARTSRGKPIHRASHKRLSAEIRFAKTSSGLLGRNRCSKGVATISRRIRRSMPRRLKTGIWLMAWVLLDAIGGINCVFCGIKGLAENMSMHQPGARHGIWHVPSITQAVREFYCASPVCSD